MDALHSSQPIGQQRTTTAPPAGTSTAVHRGRYPAPVASVGRPAPQYGEHPAIGSSSTISSPYVRDTKRGYSDPREIEVTRLKAEMLQLRIELNKTAEAKTEILNKSAFNEKIVESLNEMVIFTGICNCLCV